MQPDFGRIFGYLLAFFVYSIFVISAYSRLKKTRMKIKEGKGNRNLNKFGIMTDTLLIISWVIIFMYFLLLVIINYL